MYYVYHEMCKSCPHGEGLRKLGYAGSARVIRKLRVEGDEESYSRRRVVAVAY